VTGRWGLLSHAQGAVKWLALSKGSVEALRLFMQLYFMQLPAYNFMPKFHLAVTIYLSQDTDLPPEGEVTVGMVLAADTSPGSSGRKLTSTSHDSQSNSSASKEDSETSNPSKHSRDDENNFPEQQAIPTSSSPVGEPTSFEEEDTGSSMRAQAQQDEEKAKVHSARLVKPSTFEEQHANSVKVQSSYPLLQHDEALPFSSTGELPEKRNEKHLEGGQVKTAPIATVTPLETPPLSSSSRIESPKHSLHETVVALHQKTRVEPDSPLHETGLKTESSRGFSKSRLTSSSSSEIFHSFSGDEGVEPFPAFPSSFVSSELTMPYSSKWKHNSLATPLTATLTTGVLGGGGEGSGLGQILSPQSSSTINTAKVRIYVILVCRFA